jgi:hypothetical protein
MAGHSALATGFAGLLAGPLVRGALLMSGLPPFASYLTLLGSVHRREATIFLSHLDLLTLVEKRTRFGPEGRELPDKIATDVPRIEG